MEFIILRHFLERIIDDAFTFDKVFSSEVVTKTSIVGIGPVRSFILTTPRQIVNHD